MDPPLSAYEEQRQRNIERNQAVLHSLGLAQPMIPAREPKKRPRNTTPPEPTRRSLRNAPTRDEAGPSTSSDAVVPSAPPPSLDRPRSRPRIALPAAPEDGEFPGCSHAARQRQGTRRYAQIEPRIRDRVLSHPEINGEMPRPDGIKYKYTSYIQTPSGWNWRATFGPQGDYGSFCEPEMAAFVAWYGKLFGLSREAVWSTLGLIESEDDVTRCSGCGDVLAYRDENVIWCIGCDHEGCDTWFCHSCAKFSSLAEGQAWYPRDWFCPEHARAS